ncbi:MAG: PstS family phosphate ABC transporter substrate-binding protein, partial [Anaerolineae bacterium]
MKRKGIPIITWTLLTLLVACSPTLRPPPTPTRSKGVFEPLNVPSSPNGNALRLIASDYPLVDGSTSAQPLQMLVACQISGATCEWTDFLGQYAIYPTPNVSGKAWLYDLQHSGTHTAYVNLIQGGADFILVAREPSDDELEAAKGEGVVLDARPVARDAFVFFVNQDNPVNGLAMDTLRDIYTGRLTTWTKTGQPIQPYVRNPNSGSQELMESLVMRGEEMLNAPNLDTMMLLSMIGPVNAVAEDPAGIAYSVYYYTVYILPTEGLRLIAIDNVFPTPKTIADGSYPLTTEVYAVIREDTSKTSTARLLRDWLLTEEG